MNKAVSKIVIVGGGTAGWMTAAALSKLLSREHYAIDLVESETIGTVGVGEATLPHLRFFNQRLGINEVEFMRATNATFKAGIQFSNWGAKNDAYFHAFGEYGVKMEGIDFHHYVLRLLEAGDLPDIADYSVAAQLCGQGRFDHPSENLKSLRSSYSYAYHLDASLYAKYLRNFSESLGVNRIEGKVADVLLSKKNGHIKELKLESGDIIEGDLFIDCSGFRSLLLAGALGVGFESWSHWLPCNSAVAVPTTLNTAPVPFTKAIAEKSGWRWQIPLQNRAGNGHVYCDEFMSRDEAASILLEGLNGKPLKDPIHLKFEAGKRKTFWEKNCIAVGLSSGFLEPLESTSIYLIQIAIIKLLEFFPDEEISPAVTDEYNRIMHNEYDQIKDFLVLHYHATERTDSEFWNYCRTMRIPDTLAHRLALFKRSGYVSANVSEYPQAPSWISVCLSQGVIPTTFDPRVRDKNIDSIRANLNNMRLAISNEVSNVMPHQKKIEHYLSRNMKPIAGENAHSGLFFGDKNE